MATTAATANATPRLRLEGITKRFPGCLANDHVDLTLMPGEIHALFGENGAGKSTLVKIVYGVLRADAGRIFWEGAETEIHNPMVARRLGIGMVFQHFSLFESLSVAENIALGIDERIAPAKLAERIGAVSARYGLELDPRRHVYSLSVGERQRIEIVRCLLQEPRLLIMDEPTSVLTPQEVERLFETLRRLRDEGCTILYISHKLDEIRALCERATVLRGGRVVAACDPREKSAHELAEMMIGGDLAEPTRAPAAVSGPPVFEVRGLSTRSAGPFGASLKDVSFALRAGEIVGIAGVAGNGQSELVAYLSGEERAPDAGAIRIDGAPVGDEDPRSRRARGLALVPEGRLGHGAVGEMTLAENTLLSERGGRDLVARGFIRTERTVALAARIIEAYKVVAKGPQAEARNLSGGNLQKFIIGREMLGEPRILIAAAPTWGVDAGAAAAIHQELIRLARRGAAILVISQDLDELFVLCDRLMVMFRGRLSHSVATAETTTEEVGLLMGGLFEAAKDARSDVA